MARKLFVAGAILLFAGNCFAAPAGNTSDPKVPYGPGMANMQTSGFGPLKVSFDYDHIIDKDLEGQSGTSEADFEGQWYLFRIGYTFADRIEPYLRLGGSHLKASWYQHGNNIKVKGENAFAVGVGGKVLLYEIPEHRFRVSLDSQYRYTDPGADKVAVGVPDRLVSAAEFKVKEWQTAGIISIEFPLNYERRDPAAVYSLIPYVGFAYSDSDNDAKFTYAERNYDLGNAENDNKFLFITGCDVTSPGNVSFNVEGRWIGETSASGGFTAKF